MPCVPVLSVHVPPRPRTRYIDSITHHQHRAPETNTCLAERTISGLNFLQACSKNGCLSDPSTGFHIPPRPARFGEPFASTYSFHHLPPAAAQQFRGPSHRTSSSFRSSLSGKLRLPHTVIYLPADARALPQQAVFSSRRQRLSRQCAVISFMVSQPDTAASLTLRGASSVVSRPSLSRSKRHNRSHAGGATYVPQNQFPIFASSGDVEIIIRAPDRQHRYLLHRHTLTRCSGFFEKATSNDSSRAHSLPLPPASTDTPTSDNQERIEASSNATRRRWRFELDIDGGGDDTPLLVQTHDLRRGDIDRGGLPLLTSGLNEPASRAATSDVGQGSSARSHRHARSSSAYSSHGFFRSVANLGIASSTTSVAASRLLSADADLLRDYDNLFRIFYNYPPVLDGVNIADAVGFARTPISCIAHVSLIPRHVALLRLPHVCPHRSCVNATHRSTFNPRHS